jgi:ferric-dicitrate binding protein FerR (iron transport regulator)
VTAYKRQKVAALDAADWFVRFSCDGMSRHDRTRYLAWLKQSPLHVAETLLLMRINELLRSIFLPTDAREDVASPGILVDCNCSDRHRLH